MDPNDRPIKPMNKDVAAWQQGGFNDRDFDWDDEEIQGHTEQALLAGIAPDSQEAFAVLEFTENPDEQDWESDMEDEPEAYDWSYEDLLRLDDAVAQRHGLPADKLRALKKVNVKNDEGEAGRSCAVCQEVYKEKDVLVRLPCSHYFHADCISRWFHSDTTCPVCRHDCNSLEGYTA